MLLTDDESLFSYDCIICHELFATRLARTEHLESHFIHKNCSDCNRPVIVIGDIEFELHRSLHCKVPNVNRDSGVVVERLILVDEKSNGEESNDVIVSKEEPTYFEDEYNNDQLLDRTTGMAFLSDDLAASIVANKPQSAKPKKRQRKQSVKVNIQPKIDEKSNDDNAKKVSRLSKTIHCTQDGCNEEFRQQRLFRIHLKNQHGIIERVHCPICNFGFTDKSNLKHHMILHETTKRYICSFCGAGKILHLNSIPIICIFFIHKK